LGGEPWAATKYELDKKNKKRECRVGNIVEKTKETCGKKKKHGANW